MAQAGPDLVSCRNRYHVLHITHPKIGFLLSCRLDLGYKRRPRLELHHVWLAQADDEDHPGAYTNIPAILLDIHPENEPLRISENERRFGQGYNIFNHDLARLKMYYCACKRYKDRPGLEEIQDILNTDIFESLIIDIC